MNFDRISTGVLYVDIAYAFRGLNDPRNLVFPFYVIPEEGDSTVIAIGPTQSGLPALTSGTGVFQPAPPALPAAFGSVFPGGA